MRLALPPASYRLRLGSGPRIPDRRAQRGHEAADPTPAPSRATSVPRPGGFYSFPGDGSSQERALQTGRQLAAPATPPRGGDSHARYSVRSCSLRAGALPALRPRVHEPSSRAESKAPAQGTGSRVVAADPRASSVPSIRRSQP